MIVDARTHVAGSAGPAAPAVPAVPAGSGPRGSVQPPPSRPAAPGSAPAARPRPWSRSPEPPHVPALLAPARRGRRDAGECQQLRAGAGARVGQRLASPAHAQACRLTLPFPVCRPRFCEAHPKSPPQKQQTPCRPARHMQHNKASRDPLRLGSKCRPHKLARPPACRHARTSNAACASASRPCCS